MASYICPVCGYDGLPRRPYDPDDWGSPSYDICPSCGTQFGNDDLVHGGTLGRAARHEQLRQKWISGGMQWYAKWRPIPPGWDPAAQLRRLAEQMEAARQEEIACQGELPSEGEE